jgi:hypothetical protein
MFQHHARYIRIFREICAPALLGWCNFRGLLTITPIEPIHAAGGIDELLLAGKKRMARRANLNA